MAHHYYTLQACLSKQSMHMYLRADSSPAVVIWMLQAGAQTCLMLPLSSVSSAVTA